jgi:hypothetical protein
MGISPATIVACGLLAFVGVLGCGDSTGPEGSDSLTVQLVNDDDNLPIHILARGESFQPSNQLQPNGGGRQFSFSVIENQAETFRAGRDGIVLRTVECTPDWGESDGPGDDPAAVIWTGDALACSGWSR